jgi:hypothetical protein
MSLPILVAGADGGALGGAVDVQAPPYYENVCAVTGWNPQTLEAFFRENTGCSGGSRRGGRRRRNHRRPI